MSPAGTTLASVAGTANFGGTVSLVATLTSNETGQPVSGKAVDFTLDGTSVGTATTDSSGVATLLFNPANADPVGTHTGVVAANFAGDTNYASTSGTGDLVVSQAGTQLLTISGTSTYGGPATLTATLKSSTTSQPIVGETVAFTLDGTSAGTAITDSNGVATLTGVTTTDTAGSHTGVVGQATRATRTTSPRAAPGI